MNAPCTTCQTHLRRHRQRTTCNRPLSILLAIRIRHQSLRRYCPPTFSVEETQIVEDYDNILFKEVDIFIASVQATLGLYEEQL